MSFLTNMYKIFSPKIYGFFAPFFLADDKRYRKYQVGEYTYGTPRVMHWGEEASLRIGKYCSIGTGVIIMLGGEHRFNWISTYPFNKIFFESAHLRGHPFTKGDVVIGNDVWIGIGVIILSGVRVGDGAIIGAGSVVRKNVPAYSMVAGNPAEVVLYRFSKETIEKLEKMAWWDWPREKIIATAPLLMSEKISEFVDMQIERPAGPGPT